MSYNRLQREYRCADCGSRIVMKWTEICQSYPQNWHVECSACGSHDFIHERQLQQQESEALEILDGLPPEMAMLLQPESRLPYREPGVIFSLSYSEPTDI